MSGKSDEVRPDSPRIERGRGWYPDPSGHDELRYWNGRAWTKTRAADPRAREPLSLWVAVLVAITVACLIAVAVFLVGLLDLVSGGGWDP
jgi:hypothetical protein